ncbi:MAG: RagB/SusD family nutrient uptake outer membrane protein [Cyclobacteriaceae bacterium]
MKNIIYQILTLIFLIGAAGCSDSFLELESKVDQLENNAYQNENDAFQAMVAVYHAFTVQPWIHVPMQSDIFSDDAFTAGEPGGGMLQYQEQENSTVTPENTAAIDLWNKLYSGIYRANVYLEKEAGIEWTTDGLQDRMKAEVRVLRAHFYWDLVRHYGWVPLVTAQFESFQDAKEVTQVEPNEILTFIATELLESVDHLPNIASEAEKGRVTADMVNMLIARIYLYHEGFFKPVFGITNGWQDSNGTVIDETFVKGLVDEILASGRYSLLPDYNDVFDWTNENNAESIFEWQYSENALSEDWGGWGIRGNFAVVFFGPRTPEGDPDISEGWSFNTLSWSLYDEFEPGDPRLNATVYDADANLISYAPGYQNTGYFNAKYMPRTAYRSTDGGIPDHNWRVNYKDMRLAELYLIGAELHLTSNPTLAADYLNEVRVRAMGESARLNSITLDDIYHERRVELACEGHRKWDLLRRGLDYTKTMVDQSFVVPDGIDNAIEFSNGVFRTDTWGMLPIPASEIRLTNDGQLKQFVPAYGGG